MHPYARFLVVCTLALASGAAPAFSQTGVAVRLGTRGPGIEVAHRLTPVVSVRGGFSYLPYTDTPEYTMERTDVDLAFGGNATLRSWSLLVDVHPPIGGLRVSGGIVGMNSRIEASGRPLESYTVDGVTYSPEEMGRVSAEVTYDNRVVPYLGLGLGSPPASRGLAVQMDLGVIFSGSPDFALTGTTPVLPTASHVNRAREILDGIKVYPVLSVGVSFGL